MGFRELVYDEGCRNVSFFFVLFTDGLGSYARCLGEGYVGNGC